MCRRSTCRCFVCYIAVSIIFATNIYFCSPISNGPESIASNDILRDCEVVASATSPTSSNDNPPTPIEEASSVLQNLEESEYHSVHHRDRADIESPITPTPNDPVEEIERLEECMPTAFDAMASVAPIEEPCEPVRSQLKALYSSMPFLRTLNMRDCDFNHLNAQGCLRVPSKPILDEFVRHYFLYIHPLLPLINEADFWAAYDPIPNNANPGTPVSMLLLQSIMFASCTVGLRDNV